MPISKLPPLSDFHSLYVSPHPDDVLLSCAGRLLSEARRGLRILVITVFGEGSRWPSLAPLEDAVEHFGLGLPDARTRHPAGAFVDLAERDVHADEEVLRRTTDVLHDAAHRAKATEVYVPLGVGSHIDHRLTHEASLTAFRSGDGRNVFLYEERPEALVRGAVRVRLGQVGARLPPGAVHVADPPRLGGYLWRFHVPPALRGDLRGWTERLRSTALAARQWRQAHGWHPQKGFGPRLQPIVDAADATVAADLPALATVLGEPAKNARATRLAAAYARRLGASGHAERLWLLLPERVEGGVTTVPLHEDDQAAVPGL